MSWWGVLSGSHQCRANSVSQVNRNSNMVPAFWLCGSGGDGAQQINNNFCQHFCLGEAVPLALTLKPDKSVPCCKSWNLWNCCPSDEAQSKWVHHWVSLWGAHLKSNAWDSSSPPPTQPQSCWVLQPGIIGTSLFGTGILGSWAGTPCSSWWDLYSWHILPNSASLPLSPVSSVHI